MKRVAIIGGGILGLAIGYELTNNKNRYKVEILEKENKLGKHQSGNNSGVLHCGLLSSPHGSSGVVPGGAVLPHNP